MGLLCSCIRVLLRKWENPKCKLKKKKRKTSCRQCCYLAWFCRTFPKCHRHMATRYGVKLGCCKWESLDSHGSKRTGYTIIRDWLQPWDNSYGFFLLIFVWDFFFDEWTGKASFWLLSFGHWTILRSPCIIFHNWPRTKPAFSHYVASTAPYFMNVTAQFYPNLTGFNNFVYHFR